jgi:hypothetical protein
MIRGFSFVSVIMPRAGIVNIDNNLGKAKEKMI